MRLGAGAALRQKALIGLKASLSHQQDAESDSTSEYRLQYERHIEEARRKGKVWHSPLLGKSSTNNGIIGGKHSEYSSPPKVLARSRQISYPRFASTQESDSDSDSGEDSEERRENNVERRGHKEGREAPLPSLPTLSQIDIGRKGKEGKLQEGSQRQEQGRDETGKRSVKKENKRKGRGKKHVKNGGDSSEDSAELTSWSLPSLGLNLGGSSSVVGGSRGVLLEDSGEGGGNKGRHSGRSHVSDITTASPHRKRHSQKLDHQTMQWLQKRNMRVPLQGQKENAEKRKEYYRQVFMSLGPTDGYLDYRALVAALRAAASKTPQRKELVDLFFRGIGRGGKIDFDQFFKANSRVEKRLKRKCFAKPTQKRSWGGERRIWKGCGDRQRSDVGMYDTGGWVKNAWERRKRTAEKIRCRRVCDVAKTLLRLSPSRNSFSILLFFLHLQMLAALVT